MAFTTSVIRSVLQRRFRSTRQPRVGERADDSVMPGGGEIVGRSGQSRRGPEETSEYRFEAAASNDGSAATTPPTPSSAAAPTESPTW